MTTAFVRCANPQEVRLQLCCEMTIGEWQRLLTATENADYYGPLQDILNAVKRGISEMEKRETLQVAPKETA